MSETKPLGFRTTLNVSYEEALAQVTAALKEQGFGVLTEIDVQDTFKKKLGVETRQYTILGACNPPLAHQAMEATLDIGLLLPCNVIVYESDQPGQTVVSIVNPLVLLQMIDNPALAPVASEAYERLQKVIAALA